MPVTQPYKWVGAGRSVEDRLLCKQEAMGSNKDSSLTGEVLAIHRISHPVHLLFTPNKSG